MVLELYPKTNENQLKSVFTRNAIISKPKKKFDKKIDSTMLKPVTKSCYNIKFVPLELTEI